MLTKCMTLALAPRIRVNCLVLVQFNPARLLRVTILRLMKGWQRNYRPFPLSRLGEFDQLTDIALCIIVGATFTTAAKFFVTGNQHIH